MKRKAWYKLYSITTALTLMVFSLAACGNQTQPDVSGAQVGGTQMEGTQVEGSVVAASGQGQAAYAAAENLLDVTEMFTDRDLKGSYDEAESIAITLAGSTASCSSSAVVVSGNTVTITAEGTYILSGKLEGMIVVDASDKDKVQLVLKNAEITNENNAAIYAKEADKLFLTLAEGTQNSLSSGTYIALDDNKIDGVVFSKCDLTINGSGSLTVQADEGNGIVTKDDLVVAGGILIVTAANGHGLEGKDSVRVADGKLNVISGKDGIHSENNDKEGKGFVYVAGGQFSINSDGDGISAGYCMQIDDGSLSIVAGGGNANRTVAKGQDGSTVSAKGLKADGSLVINGGTIVADCQDDTVHAGGNLTVNGGTLQLATGDDGLHSDETTTVAGGSVNITDGYEGIEGNNVVISGGEIHLNVTDDGINAAGGKDQSGFGGFFGGGERFGGSNSSDSIVTISGGFIYVKAAGDGIDSNGKLIITGGETYVSGPENGGNGAIDYEQSGQITGGILVAVGNSQMAMNFGETSTQGSIMINVANCRAGDTVVLKDAQGDELVSYTAESSFNSVVVSCPELVQGGTYTLKAGSNETEITLDSLIYGNGMGGFGGPGGMGGFGGHGGQGGFGGQGGDFGGGRGQGGGRGWRQDDSTGTEMPEMPEGGFDSQVPQVPEGGFDGQMPDGDFGGRGGQMPQGGFGGQRSGNSMGGQRGN